MSYEDNIVPCEHSATNSLDNVTTNVYEILALLSNLDVTKSPGHDKIPALFLKECKHELVSSICSLFNMSISQEEFPTDLKKANVTPIHKKGDIHDVHNYRPVSLLPCLSKVFERVIYNKLYSSLKVKLHAAQHGFEHGKSSCTQLLTFLHDISKTVVLSEQVDILYLDLSKAIDTVVHDNLLQKLKSFGICGKLLQWF